MAKDVRQCIDNRVNEGDRKLPFAGNQATYPYRIYFTLIMNTFSILDSAKSASNGGELQSRQVFQLSIPQY